jgi:hypothetical protein
MWDQLRKDAKRKSSPVTTTYVDPKIIQEKYKSKEQDIIPSRGLDEIFEESEKIIKKDPIRKRKSGPVKTRQMTQEEREKYSKPLTDPMLDEFLKEKPDSWSNFIEEQNELDKEYKKERKELLK